MCEAVCERLCAVEGGGLCDGEVYMVCGAGPEDGGAVDGEGDGEALKDMALRGRRAGGIHAGGVDGSLAFDGAGPPVTMLPSTVCPSLLLTAPSPVDGDGDGEALKDMALRGRRSGGIHTGSVDGSLEFDGAGPSATMLPSIVCPSLPLPAPSVSAALRRCTSLRDDL